MAEIIVGSSFLKLQRGNALGDAPRHRFAPRRSSQDRTQSVQKGMRRGASHDSETLKKRHAR
ncbi:hypothetical protein CC202_18145 [Pseudomonas savastanoi]|nr:hypothetical protein CC202_18145 [Pseudomonas savastanoi]